MIMNKVQVDAEWLERVTVDVSNVTAAVREIADQARSMRTLLDDARARELRVRELHQEGLACVTPICIECNADWPCDTISALGVDPE
jgi:hypothetical protein